MKHHRILLIALGLLIASQASQSQEKKFGIGLMLGEPTGVSAKYWTSSVTALDFALGSGVFGDDNGFHFHMDYLWHSFKAFKSNERLPLYYGVGGSINTHGENSFSARGVLGVAWMPGSSSIDVFLEFAPALQFTPDTDFRLEGGAGVRYFF